MKRVVPVSSSSIGTAADGEVVQSALRLYLPQRQNLGGVIGVAERILQSVLEGLRRENSKRRAFAPILRGSDGKSSKTRGKAFGLVVGPRGHEGLCRENLRSNDARSPPFFEAAMGKSSK